MRAFSMELWAGRVSLHEVVLTPKEQAAPVEKVTVANASCQIRWSEWSSGIIPMEATLEDCSVTLHQGDRIRFLKEHIRLPHQLMSSTAVTPDCSSEARKSRIVLTALTAKNVTILDGANQPALASGLNCAARRSMAGWHGELTAESLGLEALPLTHVQIGFSTETQGTRVAEFRCNLKEGTISGNGWCSNDGLTALDLQVNSFQLASIAPAWLGNAISGMVSGSFNYNGDPICWQHGTIAGSFALTNGSLKLGAASPILSMLSGTTTGGALRLDSASATLTLTPEQWTLSRISMKKSNLFEIEGQLSCGQAAKLKADLKLGVSNQSPLSLGQSSSAAGQGEKLTWTSVQFETTPDQLWPGILAALLSPASAEPTQPAAQKPAFQEKTKAAVDAVMNILSQ